MPLISVRLILASLVVVLSAQTTAQGVATRSTGEPARVVFVCEHGSVKSLVATVYFNRRAQERRLAYRAVARGIAPERTVSAGVLEGLHADGFEVSGFVPRMLSASDLDDAALVVSFDEDITAMVGGRVRYLKWDHLPGVLTDYGHGCDAIVIQVDALLDEFARSGSQ